MMGRWHVREGELRERRLEAIDDALAHAEERRERERLMRTVQQELRRSLDQYVGQPVTSDLRNAIARALRVSANNVSVRQNGLDAELTISVKMEPVEEYIELKVEL